MLVRFLVLELLFQALSRYSKILVYTCISTIFCSRTVILQLLVVQVVWFLLQFLCLRCIARSAYVKKLSIFNFLLFEFFIQRSSLIILGRLDVLIVYFLYRKWREAQLRLCYKNFFQYCVSSIG